MSDYTAVQHREIARLLMLTADEFSDAGKTEIAQDYISYAIWHREQAALMRENENVRTN